MEHDLYQIGELARLAKVNIQTIRYYERIQLLKPKHRKNLKGARIYNQDSLKTLSFIRHAQSLGFQLGEIKELLNLNLEGKAKILHIKGRVQIKLNEIQVKIKDLKDIEKKLKLMMTDKDSLIICGLDK